MEFHQIRYFLAASDHLNFTRAAEACNVSQPALTVAVRKLEDELGGPLFSREGGRIALTELGRAMRSHLARIDETRRAASQAAAAFVGAAPQEVNLGIYSTIGPRSVCSALSLFRESAPDVTLAIHDVWGPRAYELLLSGAFDCALVARHGPLPERITAVALYTEPMVLAVGAGHPLSGRAEVSAADLGGVTYFDRMRCEFREEIQAELRRRGIAPRVVMRSEPEDWVQSAIAKGKGVTIMPRDQVMVEGVVTVPVADLGYDRVIEFVTVTGRALGEGAGRLVDFLSARDWSAGPG